MTQKSAAKPHSDASAKVVVFGVDDDFKPPRGLVPQKPNRAGAHRSKAASPQPDRGHQWHRRRSCCQAAGGPDSCPWQWNGADRGQGLYEQIVATINPRGEAGQDTGASAMTALPATWDAIKPGHLVLAHESLVDGWWEAIVVDRTGDKLILRMRDYPAYARFTVPVTAVALLSPKAS